MNEPSKEIIVTIKATKSSNNKIYYQEQFGDDSYWRRIGKEDFDYSVTENKDYALEVKYDDTNSVIYMRYKLDNERSWSKFGLKPVTNTHIDKDGNTHIDLSFEKLKNKKSGCASSFIMFIAIVLFAIILLLQF